MEESCPKAVLLPLRLEASCVRPSKYGEILGPLMCGSAGQDRARDVLVQGVDTRVMDFSHKPEAFPAVKNSKDNHKLRR